MHTPTPDYLLLGIENYCRSLVELHQEILEREGAERERELSAMYDNSLDYYFGHLRESDSEETIAADERQEDEDGFYNPYNREVLDYIRRRFVDGETGEDDDLPIGDLALEDNNNLDIQIVNQDPIPELIQELDSVFLILENEDYDESDSDSEDE